MRIAGLLVASMALLLPASTAAASEIAGSGATVAYTAGPGEQNRVLVNVVSYDTMCGTLGAPCLSVWDSGAHITRVSGSCVLVSSDPFVGDTAYCALPASVTADLGDRDDAYWDWNGPSTVDAGHGNDNPVYGAGGDDVLRGGIGSDTLFGQEGDDVLDGGPGDDYLEGVPCGCEDEAITHGADTYVGGGGNDSVTYEGRSENLALSPNGVADDGAPGEGDNIGADIGTIVGGHGSDRMTGNAGRNAFSGGEGDDALYGAAGDDQLAGGPGADRLIGDAGQDVLAGGDGDDVLNGGEGVDRFWGEDVEACIVSSCASGQDRIEARDGAREQINCGPGTDSLVADAIDKVENWVDLSDQCESIDAGGGSAPAATAPEGGGAIAFSVASARVDRKRRIVVRLTLPGPGVVTVRATARRHRVGRVTRRVRGAGELRLRLRPARSALRRLPLKVRLRIAFKPASGPAPAEATRRVTLRRRG